MTSHRSSSAPLRPDEIRDIVANAKAKGLLASPGECLKRTSYKKATAGESAWVDVDPATAKEMLAANKSNRPVSRDTVLGYAREMAAGAWIETHQGIAFDDSGRLIDGQHRLLAVAESGATVRMLVTYDLPERPAGQTQSTMDVVDRGRVRSVGSQLKIAHGLANGTKISAIAVKIATLCRTTRARRLSVRQTLFIYGEYKAAIDWLLERKAKGTCGGHSLAAAFAFAMTQAGEKEKARIEALWPIDAAAVASDDPVRRLVEFLESDDALLLNKGTERALSELTLHAILLQLRGERVAQLEPSTEGLEHFMGLDYERTERVRRLFRVDPEKEDEA